MPVTRKKATKAKAKSKAKSARTAHQRSTSPGSDAAVAIRSNAEHPKAWTFLTNHAHVLVLLHGQPGLVLRQVAAQVGITERAVQRIVQDLEDEGFLVRHKVGRRNEYEVLAEQTLRHPIESHRKIGELLKLMRRPQ